MIAVLPHAVWRQCLDFEWIGQKMEPLKEVIKFVCEPPANWLNYYNDLSYNLERLELKRDILHARENDVLMAVQYAEARTVLQRRQEVPSLVVHLIWKNANYISKQHSGYISSGNGIEENQSREQMKERAALD
ncbi:hypothetical protein Ancab_025336 [Ancistrocladus abbreviatus]